MAGGGGAGSSSGGSASGGGAGGRKGDWDCGGCGNRNYAFRSLCNRCKQPRLLVDPHTPRDSKWLPRAGDWICTDQILKCEVSKVQQAKTVKLKEMVNKVRMGI